jgi:predicted regulator of Ras-like GTPase activity (Roadblock/LC7/MglB family)
MRQSAFTTILRRAVDDTPNAVGGAFAAEDGEMVDAVATGDPVEWALLTAHYGVILGHLEAAFDTLHFGGTEYFVVHNRDLSVIVHTVEAGYFALLAIKPPAPIAVALDVLRAAAAALRREMW